MSLKWVGIIMAALGCIALGFGLSRSVGGRAAALEELTRAMRLLASRVLSLREPMEQAVYALRHESELFSLFAYTEEGDYMTRWHQALDGVRALTERDRAEILQLISDASSSGRDAQKGIFETGLTALAENASQAETQARRDKKLYRELGLLMALAVVILAV